MVTATAVRCEQILRSRGRLHHSRTVRGGSTVGDLWNSALGVSIREPIDWHGFRASGKNPCVAVTVGVLGTTLVERDGARVDVGSLRQRALLVLLALNAGRPLTFDAVVDALWGDEVPGRAETAVHTFVANLRRALEPDRAPRAAPTVLITSGRGYRLDVPDDAVDGVRFAALANQSIRAEFAGDAMTALDAATKALACWRGPALVDIQGAPFAVGSATRLEADRDRQHTVQLRALVDLGRYGEALGPLEQRVNVHGSDEGSTALLMQTLYCLGRPADALSCYARLRGELELRGLLPSPALEDLELAILRHDLPTVPAPSSVSVATKVLARPSSVVGRDEVWSRLSRSIVATDGRAAWVVLRGEPGIGKTYLADALADATDGAVMWGSAHRDDDQQPLGLWSRIMSELDVSAASDLSSVAARIGSGLRNAARGGRILVVLDDVQWADAASLRVLQRVPSEVRRAAVTFIVTTRPTHDHSTLEIALAEIMRQPDASLFELTRFAVDELTALAAQLGTSIAQDEARALFEASGGNPLLARELLRLPPAARTGPLPREVAAIVVARLEPLPTSSTELLQIAALAGDDIDVDLLAAVTGLDRGDLLVRLEPAMAAAIVESTPLRFRHTSLRDAVLSTLAPTQIRGGHLRLATAMSSAPDRWPPARVVHHLAAASPLGDVDTLVAAARHAADDAARVGAFSEQARLLEVAMGDVRVTAEIRLPLALAAAEACVRAGSDIDAQRHITLAFDLADVAGDRAAAAQAVRVLVRGGGAWSWVAFGRHPVELLSRIERACTHTDDADPTRALFLSALAVGESYGPDPWRPEQLADEALRSARDHGDPIVLAEALIAASWTGFGIADPKKLLALVDALDRVSAWMPPERHALAQAFRLAATFRQGDLAAASAALSAGETLARVHRLPAFEATFAWARTTVLASRGELVAADDAAARAYALHTRTQVYAADLAHHLVALHLAAQRGELAGALAHADGIAALDDHGDLYQALVAASAGAVLVTDHIAARVTQVLAEVPAWHRVSRLAVVGHLVADLGLTELIPDVERALLPFARELVAPGTALVCGGPVSAVLARLAFACRRPSDAIDILREALDMAEPNEMRGWTAPLHADLARSLHAVGDSAGANRAARCAIEQARRVGQPGVAASAARLAPAAVPIPRGRASRG